MKFRDGAVAFASVTAMTGVLVGAGPEAVNAYEDMISTTVNVDAGRIALGTNLPPAVASQERAVVALESPNIPVYRHLGGKLIQGSDMMYTGSGVVLPFSVDGQPTRQYIATAGHMGSHKNGGAYNCANQTISSFLDADEDSYFRQKVRSSFGTYNQGARDVALVSTFKVASYKTIDALQDDPAKGLKTGEPIYMLGYSGTGGDGKHGIERTPANVYANSTELNTPGDISHPVAVGGLALDLVASNRLVVLSSVDKSFGPAYNKKIYPGDSGGAAFDKDGKFLGVVTSSSEVTPTEIRDSLHINLTGKDLAKEYQVGFINLLSKKDIQKMSAKQADCAANQTALIDPSEG